MCSHWLGWIVPSSQDSLHVLMRPLTVINDKVRVDAAHSGLNELSLLHRASHIFCCPLTALNDKVQIAAAGSGFRAHASHPT